MQILSLACVLMSPQADVYPSYYTAKDFVIQELRVVRGYVEEYMIQKRMTLFQFSSTTDRPKWTEDWKIIRRLSAKIYDGRYEKEFLSAWHRPWELRATNLTKATPWDKIKDKDVVMYTVSNDPTLRYGVNKVGLVDKLSDKAYSNLIELK
jgi:hypothetical protein